MTKFAFTLLCLSASVPRLMFSSETPPSLESHCGPRWTAHNQEALRVLEFAASAAKLSLPEAKQAVEAIGNLPACRSKEDPIFYSLKEALSADLARQISEKLPEEEAAGPGAVLALKLREEALLSQKERLAYHSAEVLVLTSLRKAQKRACLNPTARGLASVEDLSKEPSLALGEAISAMERVSTREAVPAEETTQLLFLSPDLDWTAFAMQESFLGTVANQVSVRAYDYFHMIANDFSYLSEVKALGGLEAYLGKPRKALFPSFSRLLSKATEPDRSRWKNHSVQLRKGLSALEQGEAGKQALLNSAFGSATLLSAAREYESILVGPNSRLAAAATLDWVQRTDHSFVEALSQASAAQWKEPYRAALLSWTESLGAEHAQPIASQRAEFFRDVLAPHLEPCLLLSDLYPEPKWQQACAKWRCVTSVNKSCACDSIIEAAQTHYAQHGEVCSPPSRKSLTRQLLERLPRFGR